MILVIDNYDSFTFNLVQLLGRFTSEIAVYRNDQIDLAGISALNPDRILLSPGPGRPENAGITVAVIQTFGSRIPILGVCLGHQAIGIAYGGRVIHAPTLMHGRTSLIRHDGKGLFHDIEDGFSATRYHSLVVDRSNIPGPLDLSAWTDEGVVMGVRHRQHPVEGVQFHPESILTKAGEHMLKNWLQGPARS